MRPELCVQNIPSIQQLNDSRLWKVGIKWKLIYLTVARKYTNNVCITMVTSIYHEHL